MGLYPKSCHFDEAYLDPVRTLVQSNPLVTAFWGFPFDHTVLDYVWDEQERTFPTISSLLPPRESLSSSPERVFKGTLIRRPYNISIKHAPGTRGYIYIVSLEDTLVLKLVGVISELPYWVYSQSVALQRSTNRSPENHPSLQNPARNRLFIYASEPASRN